MKEREWDFVYVCLKDNDKCEDGWQSYNRNWENAKRYLDIMCNEHKLRGILVGRINCEVPESCHNMLELTDFQEYSKFIGNYSRCKFVFVPNYCDASPRVMTEAMCFGLPILVNRDIVGGWKYVARETGEEFDDDTFSDKLKLFMSRLYDYRPREWFIQNYGTENSGKRLLNFVAQCIPTNELNIDTTTTKWLKCGV
jgi:glycosyltransferase involved in cell wall biosynthesis